MSESETKDQKNKEAVLAMRAAQAHMKSSIERVENLERALKNAADNMAQLASFLPDNLYVFSGSGNQVSAKKRAKEYEALAREYL